MNRYNVLVRADDRVWDLVYAQVSTKVGVHIAAKVSESISSRVWIELRYMPWGQFLGQVRDHVEHEITARGRGNAERT